MASIRAMPRRIITARDAADLLAPHFAVEGRERLAALHLDSDRRVLGDPTLVDGGADAIELPMAGLLRGAVQAGAAAIILAHNHPSGDPAPSKADLETTRRLAAHGAAIGIRLHDHLIFAGAECCSLRGMGLL